MEASCYYNPTKAHNFCSSLFSPKPNFSSIPSQQPIHPQRLSFSRHNSRRGLSNRGSLVAAIGCAKGGSPATGAERELEEEMKSISGELDGIGGRWREKCEGGGGGGGIGELLECLEREAIAGEDEGREPKDYNRRAIIFDKSSRVFQALKEKDAHKSS